MLTDLLNRFIASLTYANSVNRYGLVVPGRMRQAVLDMHQLEAEVQRLQDLNTAMQEKQKSLEFYVQDSRRYRQIRNSAAASTGLSAQSHGAPIRGIELDRLVDLALNQQNNRQNIRCALGLPVVQLPINN